MFIIRTETTKLNFFVADVTTEDNLQYQFFPLANGFVNFKIRASNDAHLALTIGPQESDPMYEVSILSYLKNYSFQSKILKQYLSIAVLIPLIPQQQSNENKSIHSTLLL